MVVDLIKMVKSAKESIRLKASNSELYGRCKKYSYKWIIVLT
jgi:hypothetical protein